MVDVYVNDIMNALKNRSYFSALALTLALPDMCGAVEYPKASVTKRYINWYSRYVEPWIKKEGKDNPDLSGEVGYNLRNTFLHQGLPAVDSEKIKEESNRINQFALILGDETALQEMTISMDVGELSRKLIMVDVTFLCKTISSCALNYYRQNSSRFVNDCIVISQDELYGKAGETVNQEVRKDGPDALLDEETISQGVRDVMNEQLRSMFRPEEKLEMNEREHKEEG